MALLASAAITITVAGLRSVPSLGAILAALLLVVVAWPVAGRLKKLGAPNWVSMLALIVVMFLMIAVMVGSIIWAMADLAEYLSTADFTSSVEGFETSANSLLDKVGIEPESWSTLVENFDLSALGASVVGAATSAVSVIGVMSIVLFSALFMAIDAIGFVDRLGDSVAQQRPGLRAALGSFATQTRSYFVVATFFGAIIAALDAVALMMMGVPLALTWGVLSLITNYIPNVGFFLGLIPPAIIAWVEGGIFKAFLVWLVYFVINTIVQNIIQPKVVGDTLGLSATLTFASLLFWAYVFGAIGALIAVPMTLLAKALLIDIDPDMQWMKALVSLRPESSNGWLETKGEKPPGNTVDGEVSARTDSQSAAHSDVDAAAEGKHPGQLSQRDSKTTGEVSGASSPMSGSETMLGGQNE